LAFGLDCVDCELQEHAIKMRWGIKEGGSIVATSLSSSLSSLSVAAINMEAAPHKDTDTDTTDTDTDTNEESQMKHRMNYDESTYRSE